MAGITQLDYWYDGQMRRYLEMVVRAFSGWQYMAGSPPALKTVPCRYATTNRLVANIMRNQSSNTLLTPPIFTVYQTGLVGRRADLQYPGHVDTLQVREREIQTGLNTHYTGNPGNRYTVQRLMPRPFDLGINVDLWTTNLDQKHQILEQVLTTIYPTFEIQNSDNALDWSALTYAYVEDTTFTSRAITVGTEDEIDIATIQIRIPIWLNPPAKVISQQVIRQVISNINSVLDDETNTELDGMAVGPVITTPGDHHLQLTGNVLTLLNSEGGHHEDDGSLCSWAALVEQYGMMRPGTSRVELIPGDDSQVPGITGTFQFDPTHRNLATFQVDPESLPSNTLPSVTAVIDPLKQGPGIGLPAAAEGQRYLLLHDLTSAQIWGGMSAKKNDIIAYQNGHWTVSFFAADAHTRQYALNQFSGQQLAFDGHQWTSALDGVYAPGFWHFALRGL